MFFIFSLLYRVLHPIFALYIILYFKSIYKSLEQKLSISYLDTMSTGDLLSRFTNDVDAIVVTFSQSIGQVINASFTIIGVIISIFLINPVLAAISIVLIPILFVFILFFIHL